VKSRAPILNQNGGRVPANHAKPREWEGNPAGNNAQRFPVFLRSVFLFGFAFIRFIRGQNPDPALKSFRKRWMQPVVLWNIPALSKSSR